MSNGSTYFEAAKYLADLMFGGSGFLGWWTFTDHATVGNFMLTVKAQEYKFLFNVYWAYKSDSCSWMISGLKGNLTQDLMDLFSSSEQKKYLSHLNIL
jgi:hypothetical protein